MARRFPSSPRRGPKRLTQWIAIPFGATSVDNSAVLQLKLNASALLLRPFTVIRTHMEINIISDQTAAAEDYVAALGLCVVSDSASTAGVASVPTPITEADSDLWFVHQWMMNGFDFKDATGFQNGIGQRYVIDSRAMRKVNNDQDIVVVAEGDTAGEGALINSAGRMLVKLH